MNIFIFDIGTLCSSPEERTRIFEIGKEMTKGITNFK
jgi:hypothetical protein